MLFKQSHLHATAGLLSKERSLQRLNAMRSERAVSQKIPALAEALAQAFLLLIKVKHGCTAAPDQPSAGASECRAPRDHQWPECTDVKAFADNDR